MSSWEKPMQASRSSTPVVAVLVAAIAATIGLSIFGHAHKSGVPASTGTIPPAAASPTTVAAPNLAPLKSAVIAVNLSRRDVTLERSGTDSVWPVCPGFMARSAGVSIGEAGLQPGDFATAVYNRAGTCLASLVLIAPPQPAQCDSARAGGYVDGLWVGANQPAQSVLYQEPHSSTVLAAQWCGALSIQSPAGLPANLSEFGPGARVRILSSSNGWITGLIAQPKLPGSA